MNSQLEFDFDAPAPGDPIKEIARRFGMRESNVKGMASRYGAPILSADCYWLWLLGRKDAIRLAKNARQKHRTRARKECNRQGDVAFEIARRFGLKLANVRANIRGSFAPTLSVECYWLWWRGRKEFWRLAKLERQRQRLERRRVAKKLAATTPEHLALVAAVKAKRKVTRIIRARVRMAFVREKKRKSTNTIKLLGCSIPVAMQHLEKQFTKGMSWQNLGKVWHMDHIVPVDSFDLALPQQQRLCFHYTNLQPLFIRDNLSKGNRFRGEHQFCLLID